MKWILFYQTPYDRVKFITDENQDGASLSYRKFCDSLTNYLIKDRDKFQAELDTFHTVFLNIESGEWRTEIPDKIEGSFEELVKLNPNPEERKKQEEERSNREVTLTKNYFDKKWDDKKLDMFKRYGN